MEHVSFSKAEVHGILCAAMFHDYNTIFNGADNAILVAITSGDTRLALRLAIIKLANYKQDTECHDRKAIQMDSEERIIAEALLDNQFADDVEGEDDHVVAH